MNIFNWTLKTKFLLIILLIFTIPVGGVFILKEVEQTLIENLKTNLLMTTKMVSLQLGINQQWFNEIQFPNKNQFVAPEIFVFPMTEGVQIDGNSEDWLPMQRFKQRFKSAQNPAHNQFELLLGSFENTLHLLLTAIDQKIVYSSIGDSFASDQIVLSFLDEYDLPRRIFISPQNAGEINAKKFVDEASVVAPEFHGFWQENSQGFVFELRFPKDLKPKELRVTHFDVDEPKRRAHQNRISSSAIELNPLVWPSESINDFVQQIALLPGQRLWVLDRQGRAIARKGALTSLATQTDSIGTIWLDWLFLSPTQQLTDLRQGRIKLDSALVFDSLKGKSGNEIEFSIDGSHALALAATPIMKGDEVIGAVFIEENVAKIQLLQRQALANMLTFFMLVIGLILLLIGWYVSRVSSRIVKLKKQIAKVVDNDGRMKAPIVSQYFEGDEIDDLTNAFYQMGSKLYEYNDYLEKLASRLSHELRTPIAIVRSSLDNLLLNNDDKVSQTTIKRALSGTERLGEIITRMRRASGVKDAMRTANFETINFADLLIRLVAGFSHSFPKHQFQFSCNKSEIYHSISTDLMAEMLDKLLSNAMDFSEPNTQIEVALTQTDSRLILSITNKGKTIAKKNHKKIFQSLVSVREKTKSATTPHLGLGLYIVRLIANFHGATVKVENLGDNSGVSFFVIWKNNKRNIAK